MDDDLTLRCKEMLAKFHIKELKEVLGRFHLSKQGKKQVLVQRIVSVLAPCQSDFGYEASALNMHGKDREDIAHVIEEIYRSTFGMASCHNSNAASNSLQLTEDTCNSKYNDSCISKSKTQCPCGSPIERGLMIQCEENSCSVWQHLDCVVVPENDRKAGKPDIPSMFYCEVCRIKYSDPFCVTISHPVQPIKLIASGGLEDGSGPLQSIEKTFILSKKDRELLKMPDYDLQVWCILLNDVVYFRMQWPQYSDLHINGTAVRVTSRGSHQLLGVNSRDYGAGIIDYVKEGVNKISFSAYDARPFCLGVRIIKRRTVSEVLNLVPGEKEGETLEKAVDRVCRCMSSNTHEIGDDGDNDLEVLMDSITVNLRCPLSGSRIKVAGRFRHCEHLGCFDLQTYLELNQNTKKWQCPTCMKNYVMEHIVIDQYMNRIVALMETYPEDVVEVEIKSDASWRPKLESKAGRHGRWHLPDGRLLDDIKEEHVPADNSFRKRRFMEDGQDKFNSGDTHAVSRELYVSGDHNPNRNKQDMDPISIGIEKGQNSTPGLDNVCSIPSDSNNDIHKEADVIILSDSDDENAAATDLFKMSVSPYSGGVNHQSFHELQVPCNDRLPDECLLNKSDAPFGFFEHDPLMVNSSANPYDATPTAPAVAAGYDEVPLNCFERPPEMNAQESLQLYHSHEVSVNDANDTVFENPRAYCNDYGVFGFFNH